MGPAGKAIPTSFEETTQLSWPCRPWQGASETQQE